MAATAAPETNASVGGFDELFVQPVEPHDGRGSLPPLPGAWRHAGLVALVVRQPRERRETILAGGFALAAVLWAPLGVLAFMTRNALLFGVLSGAAAIVAAAPRPATGSVAVGDLANRVAAALRDGGHRVAVRLRSADRSVATAVRRGVEGLHSGGGRDHSTPSSAR